MRSEYLEAGGFHAALYLQFFFLKTAATTIEDYSPILKLALNFSFYTFDVYP